MNLHRELQCGQDVLYFRLEDFWSQFSFSNPHLVSKKCNLHKVSKDRLRNALTT